MVTADQYKNAIKVADITTGQLKMLKAHSKAPDRTITSSKLAEAAGYKGYQAANLWYGKLGKAIAMQIGTTPDRIYDDGSPIWTFILADGWRAWRRMGMAYVA